MATAKKNKSGKNIEKIYNEVTGRIIEALEEGVIPWHRPWKVVGGVNKNWVSGKPYRGTNQLLLDLTAQAGGYRSPYWVTYIQAEAESLRRYLKDCKENGESVPSFAEASAKIGRKPANPVAAEWQGRHKENAWTGVKAGEKGTLIFFWKTQKFEKKENGSVVRHSDGSPVYVTVPILRSYRVFNSEQTDLNLELPDVGEKREHNKIEAAQEIIDECPNPPQINHRGDRACYIPALDVINLPEPEQFDTDEHYYATAFHELVHATGHESRTKRVDNWTSFGSDPYAKEELVAEIGAAILAGHAEIDIPDVQTNTVAYIQSWIKRFKEDKSLLVKAGSKAQQAADYVLDIKFEEAK